MTTNPYATPPGSAAGQQKAQPLYEFRSTRGLVKALTVTFTSLALLTVLAVGCSLVVDSLIAGLERDDDASSVSLLQMLGVALMVIGGLYILIYIINVVLFCIWTNRANTNARALGADAMKFTPGWAVGWYFIPFANLFKPYQAMKEIYTASNPNAGPREWDHHPVPSYVGWWWGTWIAANILGRVEHRMSDELGELATLVSLLSGVCLVTAAVLAIRVIRAVQTRQEEKYKQPSTFPQDKTAHGFGEAGFQHES